MRLKDLQRGCGKAGDCGNPPDQVPDWMDFEKFQRGQEFFRKHVASFMFAWHCTLIAGFAIERLLVPLLYTKQSSTPEAARRRYIATVYYAKLWHSEEIWNNPNGDAYKSILKVRGMHNGIAQRMNTERNTGDVYFSQYDMSLVQYSFLGLVLLYPEDFGISCTRQELEDYVFFWRGIGYLMGMEDEYNLCSNGFDDLYAIGKEIETELLLPGLRDPPKGFELVSDSYIRGTNAPIGIPLYSVASLLALGAKFGQWNYPELFKIGLLDRLRVWFYRSLLKLLKWSQWLNGKLNEIAVKMVDEEYKKSKKPT